jgi:hypothetical protein
MPIILIINDEIIHSFWDSVEESVANRWVGTMDKCMITEWYEKRQSDKSNL